jgi:hypothetical protein
MSDVTINLLGVKSHKDYALKLEKIRNSGERPLVKEHLIKRLTGDYYEYRTNLISSVIHDNLNKNMETLAEYIGRKCTPRNISTFMGGLESPADLYAYWTIGTPITSIRSISFLCEFYAIPMEILLFQDIRALYDKQTFQKVYADLSRQSRY